MAEEKHVDGETSTRKIGKSVLDHFAHISNENEAKRVKNASLLLQYLYKSNGSKETAEIRYALKRIVRGLGGSKASSRVGFYSTLVALLHVFPHLGIYEIFECIRENLQAEAGNSKSEAAELYTGQILACGALIRSRKIFAGAQEEKEQIVRMLVNAGKSRSYLSMASMKFLAELITTSSESQFEELWHLLKEEILKPWSEQNHDSLYLMLLVHKSFPIILRGDVLKKTIGSKEILCEANLGAICNILLNSSSSLTLKHFIHPLLCEMLADTDLIFVAELERQLTRANRIKLMTTSILIRHLLANCQDSTKIPALLFDGFVRQLLYYYRTNRVTRNDAEFQDEIAALFDTLGRSLQKDDVDVKTKLKTIKKLIFYPGSFMFESVTKSKNVQKLVRILDKNSVKKLAGLYRDVLVVKKEKIVAEHKTEMWLNSERIYAGQLLTKLLTLPVVQDETSWKVKNLQLLADVALLTNKYGNVGIELANNVKETLFRALDLKFNKLEEVASVLSELVRYLRTEVDNLRNPLTEEELGLLTKLSAITSEEGAIEGDCRLVFKVLFLHMGLQLFNDKDLAVSSLNELFMCYEKVANQESSENGPDWIDVVVDLFLNLLSHNSLLLRNIVGSVFPTLCKYMTASSLHQILSVLDPHSDTNPLSLADESESESEGNESESDPEEDDETVNDRLRTAVREALGNNGYQTDDESVDLDDMTEDDAERLDKALADAFRQFKPNRGKSKKQSKQEETLTHFRIRAMDLLEIYLDSEPVMLSCLEMMLPLLQVLEFSIRDEHQKPLLMRSRHCIRKLTGLKKFSSTEGVSDAILGDFLKSVLEKGTKNVMLVQEMSNEIADCCIFVVKCSQNDALPAKTKRKCQSVIRSILENALDVYFKQRDCLTPYGLFKSIFQLNWEGCLKFVPLLFNYVFNTEIRPFRRNQALELLKLFYLNRRVHSKYREIVGEHEKQFLDEVQGMLSDFCRNPKERSLREKFVGNLFALLKAVHSHPDKNSEVDWVSIGEKVRELRSHVPLSKDAKATYGQLCKQMGIPHVVKMSENVVKFTDGDEDAPKSESRTIGARKQKKEAKARRIEGLSEGMDGFSFTNLPLDEDGDVQVNGTKRRKSSSETRKKKIKLNFTEH